MLLHHQIRPTSEKLCLKWNYFEENVNTAFRDLRKDSDFTDVTLACEDGHLGTQSNPGSVQSVLPESVKKENAQSPLDIHERDEISGAYGNSKFFVLWGGKYFPRTFREFSQDSRGTLTQGTYWKRRR